MAAPTNKSSEEILDEIFKVLQNRTASSELPKTDKEDKTSETTNELSKSHKHKKHKHKKHKHHHNHKHKSRHKKDGSEGFSSGNEDIDSGAGHGKQDTSPDFDDCISDKEKCTGNDHGMKDAKGVSDSTKNVACTVTTCDESKKELAVSKDTSGETAVADDNETVPEKRRKMDEEPYTSSPVVIPNLKSTVTVAVDTAAESNELEEGEVEDHEDSSACDDSITSPTSTSEGTTKKHKKSKHKKKKSKKKKKVKEIKRFTAPLTLSLTSRSRRLSFRSRRSSSVNRSRSRSRSRSYSRDMDVTSSTDLRRRRRSRSSSMDRRSLRAGTPINKVKLLEIARKNAMAMMAEGRLPAGYTVPALKKKDEVVAFKSAGKSLAELNDFCKLLSKKETDGDDGEDDKTLFVHHPFKPKEHSSSIVMNIRNAVQIPVKTSAEKVAEGSKLRIQFPVSSGTQHRKKESEWVPVSPEKEETKKSSSNTAVMPLASASAATQMTKQPAAMPAPPIDLSAPLALPAPLPTSTVKPADSVFPAPLHEIQKLDIGSIVSQRLRAVRKLKDNPNDIEALCQMYKSQQEMSCWAQSKQLPGQFTGSTDATILTPQQLAGPSHMQAWVKKDQFSRVAPVRGGVGMQLLQKMGWKPGEGLGKNKEGQAEPIILDIKLDKKGLVSQEELQRNIKKPIVPTLKDLSGKHPVSALVELCNKRRWGLPEFTMVFDSGPDHKKNFVFKVKVNDIEYQPTIASLNKKHAKAQCANVCLQALGLVPQGVQYTG